ncbi:amidohydrolase [Acidaminobacter sp. JC074]|uniref:M20 metallopeptidase family protein n=1 Tax=Acidaminobacter sp. JC074 TaxID=2530199 RepID=UPI001F115A6A|nr:M20 family metallopeptidase [Acidaminobacter sp. JC074]MCH4887491.1 amidohydrolase [Acidaminobacter sp. JC074]
MALKEKIESIFDELVEIRRDLHKHPELSGKELRTGRKICEYLDAWNIEFETGIAETGIVAIIRGQSGGKTIGIRADIDALPIQEPDELDFHSINDGVMHACGHDVHTTIMLGAAKVLKSMESELVGNVKFFFQPAEEAIGGADRMIKDGCLKNPDVDHVIGLHVMPNIKTGQVELKYGKLNGNSGSVKVEVVGESGHAAYPDKSIDAIVMASAIVTNLQTIVSRNVSPLNSTVLTFGKIYGGEKSNIITDRVMLEGTLRALDTESREFAKNRIKTMAESVAEGFGGKANVTFKDGYIALINDDFVTDIVKSSAIEVVGEENIVYKEFPSMGGEDFSYFSDQVPSAFFHLGCGHDGENFPLHSKHFVVNEACMKIGVQVEVNAVLKLLKL